MRPRRPLRRAGREAGMTLVELLVSLGLVVLIFGAIFGLLMFSYNHLNENSARTSAQSQLRYIMRLLKNEAGTALSLSIGDAVYPSAQNAYAGNEYTAGGVVYRTFMQGSGASAAAAPGCVPVPGLEIIFTRAGGRNDILHVTINADAFSLESDIYVSNLPPGGQIEGQSGGVISYVPPS